MKILHVINSLDVAGAERLLTQMLPIQQKHGHYVAILSLSNRCSPFFDVLKNAGISVDCLHLQGQEYNPFAIIQLKKYLKCYDIIHVHLFPSQYWVAMCKWLFGLKIPVVTTEHNTTNTRMKHRLFTWIDRWVYSQYSCIICISDAVKEVMSKRVKGKVPTITIQNGIDLKVFTEAMPLTRSSLSIPSEAKLLVQVARFREQKNQDCLIRALRLLPENVHVVFCGDGEREEYCKSLAEKLGVSERIHFLGSRTDVERIWKMADVGVMSSHWEGFGLAAVEAMAAGVPVVASRVDGLAQVVGCDELCFDDDNEQQLAVIVRRLLDDEAFRSEMANYCQHRSLQFGIERMADDYLALYEKYLQHDEI